MLQMKSFLQRPAPAAGEPASTSRTHEPGSTITLVAFPDVDVSVSDLLS